ncbi:MAG TPA: hypothetical protein VGE85_11520 [Terracidiphilus sp.]|jgi:hypothetical protein
MAAIIQAIKHLLGKDKPVTVISTGEGRYRWTPDMGDIPTRNTAEPCPHCRARCEECDDSGMIRCQAFRCGGSGIIVHAEKLCTALPSGQPHPEECACGGSGRIVTQQEICPVCKGTQYARCALCDGTTVVSTGRDNTGREAARQMGAAPLWRWHDAAPRCVHCQGTGRVQETLNLDDKKNLEHAKKIVARQSRHRV